MAFHNRSLRCVCFQTHRIDICDPKRKYLLKEVKVASPAQNSRLISVPESELPVPPNSSMASGGIQAISNNQSQIKEIDMKLLGCWKTGLIVALSTLVTSYAFAGISIRGYPPNTPINGKVVPSEAVFSPALKQGESAVVVIDGKNAMQINVIEGQVTKISSRFKMSTSGEITYRRLAAGVMQESAKQYVQIKDGETPSGVPSKLIKNTDYFKENIERGSYKCLAYTENGFGNVLVLREPGFRAEVIGTNIVSNKGYIGIEGSFSDKVLSSFEESTK